MSVLPVLKAEYKRRFITPLLFKFTRPPKLFDDYEIRLKKQVERELERLDTAEICSECNGQKTLTRKVSVKGMEYQWFGFYYDMRAAEVCECSKCNGHGITFAADTPKRASDGMVVSPDEVDVLCCVKCGEVLDDWRWHHGGELRIECCSIQNRLIPLQYCVRLSL